MKIATWNVNSLKVRLPHVLAWVEEYPVDVLCLQETKTVDESFPCGELERAGYQACFSGQKTYNGVAILSRAPLADVAHGIGGYADEQRRVIAATVQTAAGPTRIVCAYFPNGQAVGSEKYAYKLGWLEAFTAHLRDEMQRHERLALLGDFNIAPEPRDVHDPQLWEGQVLFSEPEREAFRKLVALGLVDAFRLFEQPEKSYTWWDYRQLAFRRNMGLRIDHILLSAALAPRCTGCLIDKAARKKEQPSDHAPVVATLA